eukprot:2019970-Pyramimonas_sp.AAC.1
MPAPSAPAPPQPDPSPAASSSSSGSGTERPGTARLVSAPCPQRRFAACINATLRNELGERQQFPSHASGDAS